MYTYMTHMYEPYTADSPCCVIETRTTLGSNHALVTPGGKGK